MRKKFIMIMLFLISLFIIVPNDVKAFDLSSINDNSVYILYETVGPGRDERKEEDVTSSTKTTVSSPMSNCNSNVYVLLRKYWKIIMVVSPILLILMTTLDFFKAIVSSDSDKLKKASSDALKRTLAYVILVLLPFIIGIIFKWVGVEFCL